MNLDLATDYLKNVLFLITFFFRYLSVAFQQRLLPLFLALERL